MLLMKKSVKTKGVKFKSKFGVDFDFEGKIRENERGQISNFRLVLFSRIFSQSQKPHLRLEVFPDFLIFF